MSGTTPYPVAQRRLLHETVLDAVGELLRGRGWSAVKMADVARVAGVSRQTLYNEFGSRGDLAQAFVLREADMFVDAVKAAVDARRDDPVAALAAAFTTFLTLADEDPFIRALLGGEGADELLPLVTTQGAPVLERATERLSAFLLDGWPQLGAADAGVLAETVVRLAISHASLPSGPAAEAGPALARLLGPFAERALSGSSRP